MNSIRPLKETARHHPVLQVMATGGTFSGVRTEHGYVPAANAHLVEQILTACGHTAKTHQIEPPFDSADATPLIWQRLIEAVDSACPGPVVIIHGTDTMAYSAAALAFARPHRRIIFTGAQVPLSYEGSDAQRNLAEAVSTALTDDKPGTYIAFAGQVIRATRAVKDSTIVGSGYREAQYSPNKPLLPRIGTPPLNFTCFRQEEIPVLRVYPGMTARTAAAVLDQAPKAAVMECYGGGHAPIATPGLLDALQQQVSRGLVIVAVSQSIDGGCQLGASQNGHALAEAGVLDGGDMTVEAAVAKLHYLVACGPSTKQLRMLVTTDIAGELQPSL